MPARKPAGARPGCLSSVLSAKSVRPNHRRLCRHMADGKNRHACAVFPLKMLPKCKCEFVGLIYTFMPAPFSILTKSLNQYAFVWLARFVQLPV
jgi:hypothetical protein